MPSHSTMHPGPLSPVIDKPPPCLRSQANTARFSSGSSFCPTWSSSLRTWLTACWSFRPRYLTARASFALAYRCDDGINSVGSVCINGDVSQCRLSPPPAECTEAEEASASKRRTLVLVQARAVETALKDLDRVQDEPRADLGQAQVRQAVLLGELLRLRVGQGRCGGRGRGERIGRRGIEDLCTNVRTHDSADYTTT